MAKAAQGLVQRLVQRGPELIGGEGREGGQGSGEREWEGMALEWNGLS